MATILEFPAQPAQATLRYQRARTIGAEIVLFPGVRYQYHGAPAGEVAPVHLAPSCAKRTRDRLEIAD